MASDVFVVKLPRRWILDQLLEAIDRTAADMKGAHPERAEEVEKARGFATICAQEEWAAVRSGRPIAD